MVYLSIKFEVSISTRYEDRKSDAKCSDLGVVRGNSRSVEIAPFDRAHSNYY